MPHRLLPVQIENEYGPEGKEFGAAGQAYINWAAKMAVGLCTGVPWVMCKEDAPDPVVTNWLGLRSVYWIGVLTVDVV